MAKFIKSIKEVKKTAGNTLLNGGIRCGTAVGTAFLLNGKLGEKIPAKLQDWRGEICLGLGTLVDVFANNEKIRAAGQGLQVYGAMETTVHLALKGDGAKMGMMPKNAATKAISGIDAQEPIDWEKLRKEAEAAADAAEKADERDISGQEEEQPIEGFKPESQKASIEL